MPNVPWAHRKQGGASMSKKKSSVAAAGAVWAGVRIGRAQEVGGGVRADPGFEGWRGAEHAAQVRTMTRIFWSCASGWPSLGDACGDAVDGIYRSRCSTCSKAISISGGQAQHIKGAGARPT